MPALCRALSPLCCCFVCRRSVLSSVIGDPELDSEEQALQAELATYDQRLEQLHEEHSQRRAATPTLGAPPSTPGMSGVVSQQPAAGPAAEQAATPQHPPPQEQQEEHQVLQQDRLLEQEREETQLPDPAAPTIPPSELSIVRCVTTATGTGCKDVIAPHSSAAPSAGACWTSRGHRVLLLESSCILQLWGRHT